jgi:hypothetical protein
MLNKFTLVLFINVFTTKKPKQNYLDPQTVYISKANALSRYLYKTPYQ